MLLIGAAGRNAGKTALACSIINNVSRHHRLIGIKVTTIDDDRATCPHGKGCGSCDTLDGDFSIVEESGGDSGKDTARMLEAGASRAFWLRVRKPHLSDGLEALMNRIGENSAIVCESTSARASIEPGLFLIAKHVDCDNRKQSAAVAWDAADRIVSFDGRSFDIDPCALSVSHGRWTLKRDATAIIMAGGSSSRMGKDKAMLEIGGRPMISRVVDQLRPHFKEILISAADPLQYLFLDLPVVVDSEERRGPLMGIASAIAASSHDLNFVHACDIPVTDIGLMQRLIRASVGHDAAVARLSKYRMEPLFAVYRKGALVAMEKSLEAGDGRISSAFDFLNVKFLDLSDGSTLMNLNTPEEYSACLNLLAEGL